jgi:O-antigen/teichoic acid export membrane protein
LPDLYMVIRNKKVFKNSYYNLVGNLVQAASRFITSVVIARMLGPVLTGTYSLVFFIYYVAENITNLGIKNLAIKYISQYSVEEDKENLERVFAYAIKIKLFLTIIVSLALILMSGYFADFYSEPEIKWYIILVSVSLLPEGIALIFQSAIQGLQEYKALAIRALFIAPIQVILTVAVLNFHWGVFGLVVVNLLMACMDFVIYCFFIRKKVRFRFRFENPVPAGLNKKLFTYNWQVAVTAIIEAVVWQKSEVFFLGKMSTQAEVAFYTISYNLSAWTIGFLPNILYGVLFPRISEFYGQQDRASIERIYLLSTRYLVILCVPIVFIGIGLSNNLIKVVYGSPYMPMMPALIILLIGTCYGVICGPTSLVLYATEMQHVILKVGIATIFINIGMDILLIPQFGSVGAAIANAAAQITSVTVCTVRLCRLMKLKFPINDLLRVIGCSIVALFAISVITNIDKGFLGLTMGAAAGLLSYLICLVYVKVLKVSDIDLLFLIKEKLPLSLQGPSYRFLIFVQKHAMPG